MSTKRDITQNMIDALGAGYNWCLDSAMKGWWQNIQEHGGLRLSVVGYAIFCKQANMRPFEFEIQPEILTSRNLILLDRQMTCPYMIMRKKGHETTLVLFGSREAMIATLYGNISDWISTLRRET